MSHSDRAAKNGMVLCCTRNTTGVGSWSLSKATRFEAAANTRSVATLLLAPSTAQRVIWDSGRFGSSSKALHDTVKESPAETTEERLA